MRDHQAIIFDLKNNPTYRSNPLRDRWYAVRLDQKQRVVNGRGYPTGDTKRYNFELRVKITRERMLIPLAGRQGQSTRPFDNAPSPSKSITGRSRLKQ